MSQTPPFSNPLAMAGIGATPPQPQKRTPVADLRAAAVVVGTLAFLGLPLGALWSWMTPRVELVRVPGGFGLAQENPEQYMAADGVFALLGFAAGILAALVVWTAAPRRRGPLLLSALVVGSMACQAIASAFGKLNRDEYLASLESIPVGWHVWRVPELKMVSFDVPTAFGNLMTGDLGGMMANLSLGVLVTMAFAAAFVYTVCAGWSRYPQLRSGNIAQERGSHQTSPRIRNTEAKEEDGRLPSLTC
ncbi:MAG TPA: DUF2567 domain-containing protein [Candidatus Stackebrandtia excrementipullorum]|nr:DUF2567 domain-containing protein [Candidatus Stackebrandtia excrementipullorum]